MTPAESGITLAFETAYCFAVSVASHQMTRCNHLQFAMSHGTGEITCTPFLQSIGSLNHMSVTTTPEYTRSIAEAESYEPFIVGGEAVGEVHWVRTEGAEGATLSVGLWRSEPQSFPYPFNADETIYALEGELVVDLESGEKVVLRPGDIASFTKGTESTWTVTESFKKLFVISG